MAKVKIWQLPVSSFFIGALIAIATLFCHFDAQAQHYDISQQNDSLWTISITIDGKVTGTWQITHPVYRFATADINGDGSLDAVVGVFKGSKYFKTPSRRVFIFKNFDGDIRPLWLGSRLGGELVDFTIVDNKIRAIEKTADGRFAVSDYRWRGFGMGFDSLVKMCDTIEEGYKFLNN